MKNKSINLDRIFEYINLIKKELYKYPRLTDHVIPSLKEITLLKIDGDYLNEFKKTINQIENKIIAPLKKEQRNLILNSDGTIEYCFTHHELNKLKKEIGAIRYIFNGLEYTKVNKIDQALVSYCNSITQNKKSLFSYLCLANTVGYLSNLNKKLKTIGLSIDVDDLKRSSPLLNKLFCKQNLDNCPQIEINQAFLDNNYKGILKSLMGLILERDDFEENLLKIGKSANEVFTINEDIVEKLYIIKRAKKDNDYKKGNLKLEFQVLNYFNLINNKIFKNELENKLEIPQPIEFIPDFDKNYDYIILGRKKGQTLLSLLNQKGKEDTDLIIKQFIKQTAKIHAIAPIYLIKKRKYFTKEENFRQQLKSYCDRASLNKTKTEDLMRVITPILRMIVNSRDFGFVKDANLENAIYTKDKNVISIDFEEIKYAPLQYDLTKILMFSFKQKDQFLNDYIQEYNNTLRKFQIFKVIHNPLYKEKKRLIHDDNDFKFTFLNYAIFNAVITYLNPKYDKDSEIKKRALDNAIESIDELFTRYNYDWYKGPYAKKDWYKRTYSQSEKDFIFELRNILEDFRYNLSK